MTGLLKSFSVRVLYKHFIAVFQPLCRNIVPNQRVHVKWTPSLL
jgi:hypothetical protein